MILCLLFCYGSAKGEQMLEYLRNASEKPVAKILIGVLAFSFVGWGVAEWIFGGAVGDNTLIRVGDSEITAQQFNNEKSRELAKMTREQQREIYTDAAAQNQFSNKVLMNLATQQMALNRAEDLDLVVSDKRIAQEIRLFPDFQENGEFSTFMFDRVLGNAGYSEAQFANVLRGDILRSMVLGATGAAISVPEFVVDATYNARYATRDIDYATVKYSDFTVGKPTDEQLEAYYNQNPQMVPETRAVSYVFIAADSAKPDEYDAGYATAIKVEDDIIAGETMADAAKKHNAKYVSLAAFNRENRPVDVVLSDKMIAKIFDMDEAVESEMIELKDGFLFVRVDKINPEHKAEFKNIKNSLVQDWIKAEQKKQAYVRANEMLVDLNQNKELKNKKSVNVSRTDGAPIELLNVAFRDAVGTNAIVPGADAFYVLSIKKSIAPVQNEQKRADLKKEMQNVMQNNLIEDYNSFLRREYPIEVNQKTYNRFFGI